MDQESINLIRSIESGIKPEVKLTKEHREIIHSIAQLWRQMPETARKLERSFIAICNNETHE